MKNLAIVAHVDHGKTTLIDQIFKQAGVTLNQRFASERVMDSGELERERGITIKAKNCSINWNGIKINLLDTPGHADFGGEVERSLMMVDGILLLVDAAEGPLPQTRFVLFKALERNLKVAVIINKVDREDARIEEVQAQTEELLLELAAQQAHDDFDMEVPFFYGSGRSGFISSDPQVKNGDLTELLDFLAGDYFPDPRIAKGHGLQLLVTNLGYSNYLGVLMIGRILRGEINSNELACWCGKNGKRKDFKVRSVQIYEGLSEVNVESAQAGEIVLISGIDEAEIGDTICNRNNVELLPRITVDPPTVSIEVSVNTSPNSGREGEYLTSRKLEDYLQNACRHNVALKYGPTSDPKLFILKGRGELQMAIVFEEIRRQGYELMVGRPQVLFEKDVNGELLEPFERLVIDLPNEHTGTVIETLTKRKGAMELIQSLGDERSRMEFIIPSRGLIGYRSQFLTMTKGEGLISSYFLNYRPFAGKMLARQNGAIVADRAGKVTAYALFNLLANGKQFIVPGEIVYEGQVVGEHTRKNDMTANVVREKHLSSMRTAGKDENIILPPVTDRTLDWAISWIDDDEWCEITPKNIRIRKKILQNNMRSLIR